MIEKCACGGDGKLNTKTINGERLYKRRYHKATRILEHVSRSAHLPSYGALMDSLSAICDEPTTDNIRLGQHILSRATILLP